MDEGDINCSNGCNPFEPYSLATSLTALSSPSVANNYSNSDYDVRRQLQADFVWDMPYQFDNRLMKLALGGWTLSSKFYVRSGTPFSIIDSQLAGQIAPYGIDGTLLATYAVSGVSRSCGASAVNTPCFTNSDFVASGSETNFGNVARNSFFGPGYFGMDSDIYKRFAVTEHMHFVLGASAFNLLNHTNFGVPANNIAGGVGTISTLAQQPTSAYGSFQGSAVSGRVLVLNGRFEF